MIDTEKLRAWANDRRNLYSGGGYRYLEMDQTEVVELADEIDRLRDIIDRARNFDGRQTVDGVTDRGWLSPDEWHAEQVGLILDEVEQERGNVRPEEE